MNKNKKNRWKILNLTIAATTTLIILFTLVHWWMSPSREDSSRWYSEKQVILGKTVFQKNCAVCHGDSAQSVTYWKNPFSDGSYPPPPLNGTAHTWHHSKNTLLKTIDEGGGALGGKMPSFKNVLKKEEKEAVIAYVQSLWPDHIYEQWSKRN